jgi:hypothetical protein
MVALRDRIDNGMTVEPPAVNAVGAVSNRMLGLTPQRRPQVLAR